MTFLAVNAVFLAFALAIALLLRRRSGAAGAITPSWRATALAVAGLFLLTAVFDNVMIAADLFDYRTEHRLNILIGQAPIEDFAYPLGGALLLPALWHWWSRRRAGDSGRD